MTLSSKKTYTLLGTLLLPLLFAFTFVWSLPAEASPAAERLAIVPAAVPVGNTDSYTMTEDTVLVTGDAPADYSAYWRFDGDLTDASDNGHDGGANGGAGFSSGSVTGQAGQSLLLDGVNDWVGPIDGVDFAQGDYTVATWMKTSVTASQSIFAGTDPDTDGHGLLLEVNSNGTLRYLHRMPSNTGGTNKNSLTFVSDGAWHHIAAVKEGSVMRLYIDGSEEIPNTVITDTSTFDHAMNIAIGRLGSTQSGRYFNGNIDDMRLYARALTVTEVTAIMQSAGVIANGVLTNDSDGDGDTLTAVLQTAPLTGMLALGSDGNFVYTPTLNYNGVVTYTYVVSDGTNLSSPTTVTINVTPVNDAPITVADHYTTTEDTPLTVAMPGVLSNDPADIDGDPVTAILQTPPAIGLLDLNLNGSFIYTPTLNYFGVVTFTYAVSDGIDVSNTAVVTITMTPVDDAPVAIDDSYITSHTLFVTVNSGVLLNDINVDNDPLTATIQTLPPLGNLDFNPNGSFIYTPTLNFNGVVTFTYVFSDGVAVSNVAVVTMTVTPFIRVDHQSTALAPDGSSWANAYPDLQTALNIAPAGAEIWVASGVYTPGATVDHSFVLKDDVAIYGGFAATEDLLSQRDWGTNITVLSGDIGGDDTTNSNGVVLVTTGISGTNNSHVVTSSGVTTTAVLDGFSITAGRGGGVYNYGGSPTLNNVTISGNIGGGMYNHRGWYNDSGSPTLNYVTFSGNSSEYNGGGMYNHGGSPTLNYVTFSGNSANTTGGEGGGGMSNFYNNPILNNVIFRGNSTDGHLGGGGMLNYRSSPILHNVTFSGNLSGGTGYGVAGGGGMSNFYLSSPTLINVTFSGNRSNTTGGGMFNRNSSNPTIINSIFWNNFTDSSGSGRSIANAGSSVPIISYSWVYESDFGGGWNSSIGTDGGNNILKYGPPPQYTLNSPQFNTPISMAWTSPTLLGDLRLLPGSSGIDAGNTMAYTSAITTDVAGNDRIQNGTIDMGSYESAAHIIAAVKNGNGFGLVSSNMPTGIDCGITCTASFPFGTVVTLTATADTGSVFTGWSGEGCSGTADCVVTIDSAKLITATFELKVYELTTTIDGTGLGTVSRTPNSISYTHGTTVTLTATADVGSALTGWSSGGCSGTADCVVTMDGAKSVTATFDLLYELTTTIDGTGLGTVSRSPNSISYTHSTTATLTATAVAGSAFIGWNGEGCSGTADCVVTMDNAKSVTATFELLYELTTAIGGTGSGVVSKSPNAISYTHGTTVTLTATAMAGSALTGWSGGGCSGTADCVVTMDNAKSVTATFELLYELTTAIGGTGSGVVDKSPNAISYTHGTTVTLTTTAVAGSEFVGWSGGGCSGTADCVVTIDAAKWVIATFGPKRYGLTTALAGSGHGSIGISYTHGTTATLTATAEADSTFTGWSGEGCSGTADCVLLMDEAKSVTATFDLLNGPPPDVVTYPLTTAIAGTGRGSIGISYTQGTTVTLTATADAGSTFTGWSGGGCSGTADCVIMLDAAKSVTANFDLDRHPLTTNISGTGGGHIDRSPDAISYTQGTMMILTAVPETGFTFTGWSGDASGTTNPMILTIDGAKNVTATFTLNEYPVNTNVSGSGVVTVSHGSIVTLTATPDPGYTFTGWSGDVSGTTNPIILLIDSAKNVTATYALIPVTLITHTLTTTTAGDGTGTILRSPDLSGYESGSTVTLTASPTEESSFKNWTGACEAEQTATCSLVMDKDEVVTAIFASKQYQLNFPPDNSEITSPQILFSWDNLFANTPTNQIKRYKLVVIITTPNRESESRQAEGTIRHEFFTTDTTFTPNIPLPAGDYEWTVFAEDIDGNLTESEQTFTFSRTTVDPFALHLPLVVKP